MNKSKAQAFFETTARHLFAQGSRCGMVEPSGYDPSTKAFMCRYRTDKATCAMGVHIPQELYLPEMDTETQDVTELCHKFPKLKSIFGPYEVNFLLNLQSVHDNSTHWGSSSAMRDALYTIATNWKLDGSFLSTLRFTSEPTLEPTPEYTP